MKKTKSSKKVVKRNSNIEERWKDFHGTTP
jgi:hypothetical protein